MTDLLLMDEIIFDKANNQSINECFKNFRKLAINEFFQDKNFPFKFPFLNRITIHLNLSLGTIGQK